MPWPKDCNTVYKFAKCEAQSIYMNMLTKWLENLEFVGIVDETIILGPS